MGNRNEIIKQIFSAPKGSLNRSALSFMDIDTLHYIASLREDNSNGEIRADDLPEPYRADVLTSYQKAKECYTN